VGSKNIWKINPKATSRPTKSKTFKPDTVHLLLMRIKHFRYLFASFFSILIGFGIFSGLRSRYFSQDADSASFFDLLSPTGGAKTSSGAYGNSFWDLYVLVQSGDLTLNSMKASQSFSNQNSLESHAYLLSQLVHYFDFWPFDTSVFPHLILTLSYTMGLVYIVYYFSSVKPIGLISRAILILLVILSPVFFLSLQGQNYMDRLFFGPGVYVVLNLMNRRRTRFQNNSLIGLALLSFTISERISLVLGATIILSLLWKVNNWEARDFTLLTLGTVGVCWYLYWSSNIARSQYSGNTSIEVMKNNLLEAINGTRTTQLSLFILGNAVLLILCLFDKKGLFLGSISMVPNLLVSVGGAELTGFLTHYHSIYLPILVASASIGLSQIEVYQKKMKLFKPVFGSIIVVCFICQIISVAPKDGHSMQERALYSLGKAADSFGLTKNDILDIRLANKNALLKLIKKVDRDGITTSPEVMPVLSSLGFSDLHFFPIDLGQSKYVIASYLDSSMDYPRDSAFGMVPPGLLEQWGPDLQEILTNNYGRIEQVSVGNRLYVLFKKL
jgi:hypothetical protein